MKKMAEIAIANKYEHVNKIIEKITEENKDVMTFKPKTNRRKSQSKIPMSNYSEQLKEREERKRRFQ